MPPTSTSAPVSAATSSQARSPTALGSAASPGADARDSPQPGGRRGDRDGDGRAVARPREGEFARAAPELVGQVLSQPGRALRPGGQSPGRLERRAQLIHPAKATRPGGPGPHAASGATGYGCGPTS